AVLLVLDVLEPLLSGVAAAVVPRSGLECRARRRVLLLLDQTVAEKQVRLVSAIEPAAANAVTRSVRALFPSPEVRVRLSQHHVQLAVLRAARGFGQRGQRLLVLSRKLPRLG